MATMINTLVLFMLFLNKQVSSFIKDEDEKTNLLKTEIIKMDSLLFDVAFNQYDAALFKKIISDDVEFYDGHYGLTVSHGDKIKALIGKPQKTTRKLDFCTVDQLGDFGAVQVGEHTFFKNDIPQVTGKFIHIWERKGKEWKLKRMVSYEHKPFKNQL